MNSLVSDHPYQVSVVAGVLASLAFLTILPPVFILPALFLMFCVACKAKTRTVFIVSWALFQTIYAVLIVLPLARLNATWWGGLIDPKQEVVYTHLLAIGVALLWALFLLPALLLVGRFIHDSKSKSLLMLTVLYVATEYIRVQIFHGYSWGVLGYGFVDVPLIRLFAFYLSVHALTFVLLGIAAVGALIWDGCTLKMNFSISTIFSDTYRRSFFVVIILLCSIVMSAAYVSQYFTTLKYRGMIFRVISVTTPLEEQGFGLYRTYRSFIDVIPPQERGYVLLPENAFPFLIVDEETRAPKKPVFKKETEELFEDLLSLSRERPGVVFALPVHTLRGRERFNSMLMIQGGVVGEILHKRFLVPFFEYSPFGGKALAVEMTAGKGAADSGFALRVCSEIQRPVMAKRYDILFAPANDGVFKSPLVTQVHSTMARIRAIESGSILLRATKGGFSEIIMPGGNVVTKNEGTASLKFAVE